MDNTKQVVICPSATRRVVTKTDRWKDSTLENNHSVLQVLLDISGDGGGAGGGGGGSTLTRSEICKKLSSYRSQDKRKHRYDEEMFISFAETVSLLVQERLVCHYCLRSVKVLYEDVRDGLQWTLDRCNNNLGHNRHNVMLACLRCNLRRKLMRPERYVMTQNAMKVVKLDKI